MEQAPRSRTANILLVSVILILTAALFRTQLVTVVRLASNDDRYLQIALAPLLCVFILYWERAAIFSQARFSPRIGIISISISTLFGLLLVYLPWPENDRSRLALVLLCVVLMWVSTFILCNGLQSLRKASFALCCLFLMDPISPTAMDWMTVRLQQGSAAASYQILRLLGVPVFREGMTFTLPGLVFRVAPECSGIHSWVAFVLVAMLATRIFLRSRWTMLILVASTIPIAIFKNAIRIVIIAYLTAYVDRSVIRSPLHHNGGPLFALIDLAIFVPLLLISWRRENGRPASASSMHDGTSETDCAVALADPG